MSIVPDTPHLAGIRLHPIKSLDEVTVPECRIGPGGGLELDRVWALCSPDGEGGDVHMVGTNPCPRCAVPARHSQSGVEMTGFQKRFSELRQAHYPSWARAPGRIRHFYHLGINTRVAPAEYGKVLRVGDEVINPQADP